MNRVRLFYRRMVSRYCGSLTVSSRMISSKPCAMPDTAILPVRPRSPKDKAFVEGAVGVASTWILAALRNRQFLSLTELNEAIHEKLETFNHKPFQKREGSRAACFAEEKLFLLPLPATPFELAVWKVATVQYNYHISAERMNYSVPYEYIKQQVDVRLTQTTVEIFFAGTRIASHLRLHGRPNQYSTVDGHMPPDHQAYLQWNGERFIRWAEQIGQHTGYIGGMKEIPYKRLMETKPEFVISEAIRGMMPHNAMGRKMFKKLRVYAGPEHDHQAQQPETLVLKY